MLRETTRHPQGSAMSGLITLEHLFHIADVYGEAVADRAACTDCKTFLDFLVSEGLV